jgi:hypothetical protein
LPFLHHISPFFSWTKDPTGRCGIPIGLGAGSNFSFQIELNELCVVVFLVFETFLLGPVDSVNSVLYKFRHLGQATFDENSNLNAAIRVPGVLPPFLPLRKLSMVGHEGDCSTMMQAREEGGRE